VRDDPGRSERALAGAAAAAEETADGEAAAAAADAFELLRRACAKG
jgi:hypothetical protein